jgi:hypothetical protein
VNSLDEDIDLLKIKFLQVFLDVTLLNFDPSNATAVFDELSDLAVEIFLSILKTASQCAFNLRGNNKFSQDEILIFNDILFKSISVAEYFSNHTSSKVSLGDKLPVENSALRYSSLK